MQIEFKLPELGENIENGDVVKVLVREGDGDVIAGNQGVIELETDKAVVEIPCPQAGKVAKIHVTKGQTIKVGQAVVSIEVESDASLKQSQPPLQSSRRNRKPCQPMALDRKSKRFSRSWRPDQRRTA